MSRIITIHYEIESRDDDFFVRIEKSATVVVTITDQRADQILHSFMDETMIALEVAEKAES